MEQLLSGILSQPLSALSLAAMIVIIVFQLAQAGLLNIRIGKFGDLSTKKSDDKQDSERRMDEITNDVNSLKKDVRDIKENHLAHIQEDMANIREDVSFIKGKLSRK